MINMAERKEWEEKFVVGQLVQYIANTEFAKEGQKGIVQKPINHEYYKTTIKLLDETGKFTDIEDSIYNSMVLDKVKAIDEKIDLTKIEVHVGDIDYVEEDEVERRLEALGDYKYETIMQLSQIELKVLISYMTGFHTKYIYDIEVTKWVGNTDVYQIDFKVTGFVYTNCFLIYEEGYFDLDFK